MTVDWRLMAKILRARIVRIVGPSHHMIDDFTQESLVNAMLTDRRGIGLSHKAIGYCAMHGVRNADRHDRAYVPAGVYPYESHGEPSIAAAESVEVLSLLRRHVAQLEGWRRDSLLVDALGMSDEDQELRTGRSTSSHRNERMRRRRELRKVM